MAAAQRIEIVRTDSDQPWHVRLIRNRKTFVSEKYARKVGAERAALGLADMFGWTNPIIYGSGSLGSEAALIDLNAQTVGVEYSIPLVYVDERLAHD